MFFLSYEIHAKFILSRSLHGGGIWGAAIKSVEYQTQRIVANAHLTFKETQTDSRLYFKQ